MKRRRGGNPFRKTSPTAWEAAAVIFILAALLFGAPLVDWLVPL